MNELDKYKQHQPYDISDDDINRLVNDCTERALEEHRTRGNHIPVGRVALWITSAAAVVLFAVMAIRSFSHTPVTTQLPQQEPVLAQHNSTTTTPTPDEQAPFREPAVVAVKQQSARAEKSEQSITNGADELDLMLDQLSDEELMAIGDGYYIDEIPEY